MEERYRGSHRERKIKREIGLGERERETGAGEIERVREKTTEKERHGGREEDRGWKREREIDSHREGEGETGVRER